jgi:2-polyprenyl-3-methyl-5-hydroxy-6-metoxy-1,4-benzoquinol methylase
MNTTATAHLAWNQRWQTAEGRADWLEPEPAVQQLVPHWHQQGAARVLDLGCGVGRHSLYLAARGFQVTAYDASQSGLDHAARTAAEQGLALTFRLGHMTELPFADGTFDFVLAWNVIYHGDEPIVRRTIGEIRRVLKANGWYQGTMLSKRNAKFGRGAQVAPNTFVIAEDDDKNHPHFYCNARECVRLFEGFEMLSLVDCEHAQPGSWHWHLVAERSA